MSIDLTTGITNRSFTFTKTHDDGRTVTYRDSAVTTRLGQATLTISTNPKGQGAGGADQFELRITVPRLKATTTVSADGYTPGPRVSHNQFLKLTGTLPSIGSQIENQEIWQLLYGLTGNTTVIDAFVKAIKP